MVLSTVVPTSFAAVDSLDKTRFRFIVRHRWLSFAGSSDTGGGVTSFHLIWLLSVKLGSWSCQLWYQHPSRLLTLWTKQDSGLMWGNFDYCCGEQTKGGEWRLAIWFDCSALNWDHGLVNCDTIILRGCWLFGQNEIQVYCEASSTICAGCCAQDRCPQKKPKSEYNNFFSIVVLLGTRTQYHRGKQAKEGVR